MYMLSKSESVHFFLNIVRVFFCIAVEDPVELSRREGRNLFTDLTLPRFCACQDMDLHRHQYCVFILCAML